MLPIEGMNTIRYSHPLCPMSCSLRAVAAIVGTIVPSTTTMIQRLNRPASAPLPGAVLVDTPTTSSSTTGTNTARSCASVHHQYSLREARPLNVA